MKFDRVVVISLARRPDRLAAFRARVPSDFPFGPIEHFPAIDGRLVRHPAWWRQGGGAWGCYRSHLRILEEGLQLGHERVLVLEDDATFCEGFAEKAAAYLDALPRDWRQAYLGGQNLRRPTAIDGNNLVLRAGNINRTHAYAVNGREGLLALYRHLTDTSDWMDGHHVDHHYGRLHRKSTTGFYVPSGDWLCGQAADTSDVACKPVEERWWHRARAPAAPEAAGTFVAVVGLHRSGSSAVAMMLHKLGVSMGNKLGGYERSGGGEAVGLASICEWAARFPATSITKPREALGRRLSTWIDARLAEHRIAGGKYPHLCAMGDELMAACGGRLRVVVCDRPLEESIESLQRRSRKCSGWLHVTDDQAEAVQRWLWQERERFLSAMPPQHVLRLAWDRTQSDPAATVCDLVEFLGLSPTDDQVAAAIEHIQPQEVAA